MTDTEEFRKLDDYGHARIRTEIYLGSREPATATVPFFDGTQLTMKEFTWVPALYTGLREIIDNALDEMIGYGHGDILEVTYNPDTMEFSVLDNGRGLPLREIPELGKGPAASILLGEAKSGRNFAVRKQVGGLNGLGAAVVNFVSEYFQLEVWQDGKHFQQEWKEGTYGNKEIHKTSGPAIGKGKKNQTGTYVKYKPSAKVYKHMDLPIEFVESRLWDIAIANPKLKVIFNGTRLKPKAGKDIVVSTYFPDANVTVVPVSNGEFNSTFYLVPNFTDETEVIYSMVNNICLFRGGPHIDLFETMVQQDIKEVLNKQLTKEKLSLRKDDVAKGLLVFNITTMNDPSFDSQEKARLTTSVDKDIKAGYNVEEVRSLLKKNKQWMNEILENCRERHQRRQNQNVKKKQKDLHKTKIAGHHSANARDRSKCILFIAEGESAIGGMVEARDPEVHGGIALTGKILNVHDKSTAEVLNNKVISNIISILGLTVGEKAHIEDLNYGKVFITTDSDEDGKNITALLVNFFYKYWPELFQNPKRPFLYEFLTPLIILRKGKQRKYIYQDEYDKFQSEIDKYKGWEIIRAKGLARLTQEDWKYSLDNPRVYPIIDDGQLKDILTLIFDGSNADLRKEWLANNE